MLEPVSFLPLHKMPEANFSDLPHQPVNKRPRQQARPSSMLAELAMLPKSVLTVKEVFATRVELIATFANAPYDLEDGCVNLGSNELGVGVF